MKKFLALLLAAVLCTGFVHADAENSDYSITINTASRTLKLYKSGVLIKEYPVAVGKPSTKTPAGDFRIINKVVNPYWHNKGNIVEPGPKNPLGIRWMGISIPKGTYGIHGNSAPQSIGTFASGGCVRMYNNDVEELFKIVSVGTPVQIIYEDIELMVDKYTSSTVLIAYPDKYKKRTAEALIEKLKESSKDISEEQAAKTLKLSKSGISDAAAVSDGTPVMLNGRYVTSDAFMEKDQAYVYYQAAIDYFGLDADTLTSLQIETAEKDSRIYVNMTDAVSKIGCTLKYDKEKNSIFITGSVMKVNGRFLTGYTGGFDKGYMYSMYALQYVEEGILPVSLPVAYVNLKDFIKQRDWSLEVDSLYKIINIVIPLKVKAGENYLDIVFMNNRQYIKYEDSSLIPGIESLEPNIIDYYGKRYIDLEELMSCYECKKDGFLTQIELIKPLERAAEEIEEIKELEKDSNPELEVNAQ